MLQEDDLLGEHGPARGKGDALWRALSVARGEIVVFLDADTRDFTPGFVVGLLGPLLSQREIRFVKGAFRRPLEVGGCVIPGEGGRVTELVARPLLNLYAPRLAGFDQPLAGEVAAHVDVLRGLWFPAGYGVEIANLIDVANEAGLDALAQVDLGERQNRHQPLRDLSAMSYAIMVAAATRLHDAGLTRPPPPRKQRWDGRVAPGRRLRTPPARVTDNAGRSRKHLHPPFSLRLDRMAGINAFGSAEGELAGGGAGRCRDRFEQERIVVACAQPLDDAPNEPVLAAIEDRTPAGPSRHPQCASFFHLIAGPAAEQLGVRHWSGRTRAARARIIGAHGFRLWRA